MRTFSCFFGDRKLEYLRTHVPPQSRFSPPPRDLIDKPPELVVALLHSHIAGDGAGIEQSRTRGRAPAGLEGEKATMAT